MNDRELLERAAKAAGINGSYVEEDERYGTGILATDENDCSYCWNPLLNDGEVFRLAVKLNLQITVEDDRCGVVTVSWGDRFDEYVCEESESPETAYAATRRAIVRAAALLSEP